MLIGETWVIIAEWVGRQSRIVRTVRNGDNTVKTFRSREDATQEADQLTRCMSGWGIKYRPEKRAESWSF